MSLTVWCCLERRKNQLLSQGMNPGPLDQASSALPTELPGNPCSPPPNNLATIQWPCVHTFCFALTLSSLPSRIDTLNTAKTDVE